MAGNRQGAAEKYRKELALDKLRHVVPLLDDNYDFTGHWYDPRDPNAPEQPNPERLTAHLGYLQQKYPDIPIQEQLQSGQPIEQFDPVERYGSEGFMDAAGNVLMSGFNQSLTGMAVEAGERVIGMEPEPVFDMSHWEATNMEQLASGLASFIMPIDIATIVFGGGAGGAAAKAAISEGVKKTIARNVLKGMSATGAKRKFRKEAVRFLERASKDIPTSAGAIGAYEGARSGLEQTIETGGFETVKVFRDALKGGALGAMVGAGGAAAGRFGRLGQEIGHVGSGTAAFGVAAPFLEGEKPTGQSIRDALKFMVAMRAVQGAAASPGRVRKRLKTQREAEVGPPEVAKKAEVKLLKWDKAKDLKREKLPEDTPTMKDLAKSLYEKKIDRGVYNTARSLIASRPDLDARTAIKFSDEIKPFTQAEIKAAGLSGETGLTATGRTKKIKGVEKDVVKTAIKLFKGADAETVVHEWNHDAYWRLTKAEQASYKKYHSGLESKKSAREHFADEATEFFFSEKLHEQAGPIRSLFERSKATLKKLIGRIRKFRQANVPKEILDLYRKELLRDRRAKQAKVAARVSVRKQLTEGKKKFGEGFTVEEGKSGKPLKFPIARREAVGKGFTVKEAEAVPAKRAKGEPEVDFQIRRAEEAAETFGEKAKESAKKASRFFDPIKQAGKRLRSSAGKELKSSIEAADAERAHLLGTFMEKLRGAGVHHTSRLRQFITGQKVMTEKQAKSFVDKEGNLNSPEFSAILEEFRQEINKIPGMDVPKVEKYFTWELQQKVKEQMYGDLERLSQVLTGIEKDGSPVSDAVIARHLKNTSKLTQNAIKHAEGKTLGAKLKSLNEYTKNQMFRPAKFEKARGLRLPSSYYETDVRVVLPKYLEVMSKRAALVKTFGKEGEKFFGEKGLLSEISATDPAEGRVALTLMRQLTGVYETMENLSPAARKAADYYTAWQVGTKIALGRATLANLGQPAISFLPDLGIFATARAGIRLMDPSFRKGLRETGLIPTNMLDAVLGYHPGGKMGRIADALSRASGFTGVNRMLQYWAGATIHDAIPRWHRLAQGSGFRAGLAQKRLADLKINYKKGLNPEQVNKAIYRYATDSQLQRNILKDPLAANDPRFRPLFLFKRFGFKQFNYAKDMIWRELKRGNAAPLIRMSLAGYLGGEAMVWASNNIQEWLSGEPVYRKDDSMLGRAVTNFAMIGTLGMVGDMVEIDKMSGLANKVKFAGAPVFVMDIEKALDAYTRFMGDWERYGDGWLATKRNAYAPLGFLGSYPRYAAKRLKTETQKSNREKYQKGQQRTEILQLLADGHADPAGDQMVKWNESHPRNKITYGDVNISELREYLKRKLDARIEAMGEVSTEEKQKMLREYREDLKKIVSVRKNK